MHGESKLYTVNLHMLSRSTIGLRTWAGIGHIRLKKAADVDLKQGTKQNG